MSWEFCLLFKLTCWISFVWSKKKTGLAKAICRSLQRVLCDPPLLHSVVCLMNLFLVRSVKWQPYYISWLDSWFLKLENGFSSFETWFLKVSRFKIWVSRNKMRVTVNLLLSSTVCYSFILLVSSHFRLKNFIYYILSLLLKFWVTLLITFGDLTEILANIHVTLVSGDITLSEILQCW